MAAVLPPLARHLLQPTSRSFLCDVREMVALPARARASILLPDFYNLMPLGYKKMNVLSRKILPNMLIRLPNHIRPWRHLVMFPLIQPEILCFIRFQDTFTSVWTSWKMCLCTPSLHHPHHALLSAGPSGSHTLCTTHIMHRCLQGPVAATSFRVATWFPEWTSSLCKSCCLPTV